MPRINKYQHYSVSPKKKQAFSVDLFLGVDYNPAQLSVAKNHAIEIENIIYKNDFNQKRNGWEQIAQIKPVIYYVQNEDKTLTKKSNTTKLNGLWVFVGDDNKECIIAHVGKLLFKVSGIGKSFNFLEAKFEPIFQLKEIDSELFDVAEELEDAKSSAFVGNKCLYVLGGNYLFKITSNNNVISIVKVEDDKDTYIPTTTIGITYADSPVSRTTALDDVNLMTQNRKNKLVSGTYIDDGVSLRTTRFWDWQLDTNIKGKKATDINNIEITINELKEMN